jgi:hypothetical protein
LRAILESAQAKNKERTWVKQKLQGELDDNKLVDGISGDQNIYKMRGKEDPMQGISSIFFFYDIALLFYDIHIESWQSIKFFKKL